MWYATFIYDLGVSYVLLVSKFWDERLISSVDALVYARSTANHIILMGNTKLSVTHPDMVSTFRGHVN